MKRNRDNECGTRLLRSQEAFTNGDEQRPELRPPPLATLKLEKQDGGAKRIPIKAEASRSVKSHFPGAAVRAERHQRV